MKAFLAGVAATWTIIDAVVAPAFDFMDRTRLTRRMVLGVTVWMSVDAYLWARTFAGEKAGLGGAEIGLIIAAITAPMAALQGFAFKWYMQDTKEHEATTERTITTEKKIVDKEKST